MPLHLHLPSNVVAYYYAFDLIGQRHYAMFLSDDCLSDVWRLSVAYIGPNSRTERPMKTKIGTEVAHVTHDSDTTFKVKRSKVNWLLMSEIANMPEQVSPGE